MKAEIAAYFVVLAAEPSTTATGDVFKQQTKCPAKTPVTCYNAAAIESFTMIVYGKEVVDRDTD